MPRRTLYSESDDAFEVRQAPQRTTLSQRPAPKRSGNRQGTKKDYPLRRLPMWVWNALNELAEQRAQDAHLVQASVNAEILTALEQYVISKGYQQEPRV